MLAALLAPLAEADISVFTLSTFDTDWILVPTAATPTAPRRSGDDAGTRPPAPSPHVPRKRSR